MTTVPARYWHSLDSDRIQCDLCPCHCRLKPGRRGACFVRMNEAGSMVLTTWGRSSGFCIDPIEKKPLNHFFPGTPVLSFGTAGCNLSCAFCQNWDISKSREMDTLSSLADPDDLVRAARKHDCRSIAFTYNDPLIFLEYAVDVATACRTAGVHTVAVTAGFVEAEARIEFFSSIDAANVDLKAFSNRFYQKLCRAELNPVLDTLQYIYHETPCWLELTTLLIPGENDSDEELQAMTKWIYEELGADVPIHFSRFHPDYQMRNHAPTPRATLRRARKIAQDAGLQYVYLGNLHDRDGDATCCPGCGYLLIGRDWYEITDWRLGPEGTCPHCDTRIPGHFDPLPGRWGARRLPIQIESSR